MKTLQIVLTALWMYSSTSVCFASDPKYSVITGDAAKELVAFYRYGKKEQIGFWSPTAQDIQKIETVLPRLFDSLSDSISGGPDDYYRQYCGIVVNGTKLVYISFIRASIAKILLRDGGDKPMLLFDGRSSFWRIEYDQATEKFTNWESNGSV